MAYNSVLLITMAVMVVGSAQFLPSPFECLPNCPCPFPGEGIPGVENGLEDTEREIRCIDQYLLNACGCPSAAMSLGGGARGSAINPAAGGDVFEGFNNRLGIGGGAGPTGFLGAPGGFNGFCCNQFNRGFYPNLGINPNSPTISANVNLAGAGTNDVPSSSNSPTTQAAEAQANPCLSLRIAGDPLAGYPSNACFPSVGGRGINQGYPFCPVPFSGAPFRQGFNVCQNLPLALLNRSCLNLSPGSPSSVSVCSQSGNPKTTLASKDRPKTETTGERCKKSTSTTIGECARRYRNASHEQSQCNSQYSPSDTGNSPMYLSYTSLARTHESQ